MTSSPNISPLAENVFLVSDLYNISPASIALLALSASLFYLCTTIIYNLYFSPLAAIPGPWYAAISDFWLTTHVARLQQCMTIQTLFERYGPVVRVGPTKVVFCDLATTRNVYCINKFDKSSFYAALLTNDHDHAMSTLPHALHSARRKAYAPHYNLPHLTQFQPEMNDSMIQVVQILENEKAKASVDTLDLFRHLLVDVISVTVFGSYPGALDDLATGVKNPLSQAVCDFPARGIVRSAIPTCAWNLVSRIPNETWRRICDSDRTVAEYVLSCLEDSKTRIRAAGPVIGEKEHKTPLIQHMIQNPVPGISDDTLVKNTISECMGHLIAGCDTSSTTLSYLFWELSRRKDIERSLQAELDEYMPDRKAVPDLATLNKMPYLNAFVKEGLRVYGAAPSLLERVVPSVNSCDVMGFTLPPGTIVATQAWSMHRDPEVFPSPDTFLPERWLTVDGLSGETERLARMSQYMMPYGIGTRICGGQNLAQMVLRIAVAAIAANFNIAADLAETNQTTMKIKDAFVLHPATKECKLIFVPRTG
ncbi:cytochrome P450 [Trametes gibbosa]|nr:cytochrome P450 [Trametes gibbosa]